MSQSLIEFDSVTKIFNKDLESKSKIAVNNLSFGVDQGVVTGFVGPNGAGKTTSIKMALGLVVPTKGRVTLMGEESSLPSSRKKVSYISEQPYFYEHLSAEETLQFMHRLKGLSPSSRVEDIKRVLDRVELLEYKSRRVKSFSKGMQQRLNMAQALMGNPELIIMDEPMSGLDPLGRRLFRSIFRDLTVAGTTVFFSTHVIEDMESLCDKIIVLSKGELYYSGKISELMTTAEQGVEFRFDDLDKDAISKLSNLDYTSVLNVKDSAVTVLAKTKPDNDRLFKEVISSGITPTAVEPYRKSLEDILYDNKGGNK